jgi:hypothetical protein
MSAKKTTSPDLPERSALVIEWDDLYGVWCMRCRKVTEMHKQLDNLRCCECGHKTGEKLDADYARMLREGKEGEVH